MIRIVHMFGRGRKTGGCAVRLRDKLQRMHGNTPHFRENNENNPDLSPVLGGEEFNSGLGSFWRVERVFPVDLKHGPHRIKEVKNLEFSENNPWGLGISSDWSISDLVFLDTETTGLAGGTGTTAFLVGLGWIEENVFFLKQYLMRDFPEEPPMLFALAREIEKKKILVTFNGRNFDWPLLQTRFTLSRLNDYLPSWEEHWDLLWMSRGLWRKKLSSCSLNSLEKNILSFYRQGDIPGYEIPSRYLEFLRSKKGELLKDILLHNVWDILTMVSLLTHLIKKIEVTPEEIDCAHEALAVGQIYERKYQLKKAIQFYKKACSFDSNRVRFASWKKLALLFKREKEWKQSEGYWKKLVSSPEDSILALVELAKIYEHRLFDLEKAHQASKRALALSWEKANLRQSREIEHRVKRIERKIQKIKQTGF